MPTETSPSLPKEGASRKALGRGLAALMPSSPLPHSSGATSKSENGAGYRILPIERLHGNKSQPRKQFDEQSLNDLVASIKKEGILQPILVRRSGSGYEIVAGERRWRAANRAGLREVPVVVRELSDSHALQVALIENVQRQDLDPLEEAEAYGRLIREYELTHEQVADAVGKSRSAVTNSLRLLKLPSTVLVMLADGRLTAGHARALMALEDHNTLERLAEDIAGRRTSVRDTELQVRRLGTKQHSKAGGEEKAGQSSATANIEERLQKTLGTRVRLKQKGGKGHIEIHFHSLAALDGLLNRLTVG